jgi:hypothetical protein
MDAKTRSPNYPRLSLGEAIDAMRPVYAKEKRARFPRQSLARHLGYSSLNGRSLGKIGALRAYGLIEGREDQLYVSPTAIALIDAPEGSIAKVNAMQTAFTSPPLFRRIFEEHGSNIPSEDTLRWWLVQQDYVGEAAARAAQVYLQSRELVEQTCGAAIEGLGSDDADGEDPEPQAQTRREAEPLSVQPGAKRSAGPEPDFKGKLSGDVEYSLYLRGDWGARDLAKLVRVLQLQQQLMQEDDLEDAE